MENTYDVIIVGAGPAAWSAAIFLVRAGISTLVIGRDSESGLADAADVRNFPGFPDGVSGRMLLDSFMTQAERQGVLHVEDEVTHTEKQGEGFIVKTSNLSEFIAKYLILAHGANYIKANLPGEKEFVGNGVHYCALCDGPIYKDKDVMVLGNGSLAAEEAAELSENSKNVKIITHSPQKNISPAYEEFLKSKNIGVQIGRAKEIKGENGKAISLIFEDGKEEKFDGLFIALGIASSINFAQKLGLELNGNFIKVDENMRTSVSGVWSIGIGRGGVNQIVKSVGDGGIAAVDIIKVAKGLPTYIDHT